MMSLQIYSYVLLILNLLVNTEQSQDSAWNPKFKHHLNSEDFETKQDLVTDLHSQQKNDDLKYLNALLEKGTHKLEASREIEQAIMLIGNTGSGKTSLGLYITAIENLNAIRPTRTGPFVIIDKDKKIGTGMITSMTEIPDLFIDRQSMTGIYDCPGFSDSRSPIQDVAGTYFTKRAISSVKAVKFILVVSHNSVEIAGNKLDFTRLAIHAANVIKDLDKFRNSIGLVITKVRDPQIPDKDYIEDIAYFLKATKSELKEKNNIETTKVIKIIDILLQKDNDEYSQIGIMRSPSQGGLLSQDPVLIKSLKPLRRMLFNNLQFVRHNQDDFGFTISAESALYVNSLKLKIGHEIKSVIQEISRKLGQHLDDIEENANDLKDLEKYIHSTNEILTNVKYSGNIKITDFLKFVADNIKEINIDNSDIKRLNETEFFFEFLKTISGESLVMIDVFDGFRDTKLNFEKSDKYYNFLIELEETITNMELKDKYIIPLINNLYALSKAEPSIGCKLDELGIDIIFRDTNKNIQFTYYEVKDLIMNRTKLHHLKMLLKNQLNNIIQFQNDKATTSIHSIIQRICNQIQLFFYELEYKTINVQDLQGKMNSGKHTILKTLETKEVHLDYLCQYIIELLNDLNVNINDFDIKTLQELADFLIFLKTKNNEEVVIYNAFSEFNEVYGYFEYSEKYYRFLIDLETFVNSEDMKEQLKSDKAKLEKITNLANRIIPDETTLFELDIENVFEINASEYFSTYNDIKDFSMRKEKIVRLSELLKHEVQSSDYTGLLLLAALLAICG